MFLLLTISNLMLLLFTSQECSSANILAVVTLPTASHVKWHKLYLMELVRKGHNVTILSHEEEQKKHPNFTMITLEGIRDQFAKDDPVEAIKVGNDDVQAFVYLFEVERLVCDYDLQTNGLKTLLNYPEDYRFDLIIWDLNCGRCLYPLIDRFGTPPVIGTSPFGNPPHMNYAFGGSTSSVVPAYHVVSSNGLTFVTRFKSFIFNYLNIFLRRYYANPKEFKLAQDFFGKDIKTIDEVERNISLLLSSIYPTLTYLEPLPPNIIPVGGLHISPIEKLPTDIQSLLDHSKNGVIIVAFGGNLEWIHFGQQQRDAFIGAFHRLEYDILLKMPNVDVKFPNNVVLRNWLPINDILAHPNVKLLITHGGSLTTYEAFYHGIPILGIPMLVDQFGNMGKIQNMKLGKTLSYHDLTSTSIHEAVTEILSNTIYQETIKKASQIYKNQLSSPLELAVFWTEFILQYGSANHLNLPGRDFNFLQNHDLDILAIMFALLGSCFLLICIIFKRIIKCFLIISKQKKE